MNRTGQPKIDPTVLKKILLIRLRRIGDILLTLPAVTLLKKHLPQASLSYIVEEPYRRLVEENPSLDKVMAIEKKQKLTDFLKLILQVRKEKYGAVLDFHGGPRAFWITLFSRARLKIGYKVKYKSFIYDIQIPRHRRNGFFHSVENHVNLVKAIGFDVEASAIPPLSLPKPRREEVERVKNILEKNKLKDTKIVVLHISAGNRFRDWGRDNLAELIRLLGQLPAAKIVLIGSEEDKKDGEEIVKKSIQPVLSLVGQLNLIELQELIAQASLFVGPDSGPMHIAASTSTPIVAYFGPTLPAHFSPWKARAVLLEKEMPCRPCKQRKCLYEDFRCLRTIEPAEVFNACLQFL